MTHEIYNLARMIEDLEIPEEIVPFVDCPTLLPDEEEEHYYRFLEILVLEVLPNNSLEWVTTIDLASIFWEIQRMRRWQASYLRVHHDDALEKAIRKTKSSDTLINFPLDIHGQVRSEVHNWHRDRESRTRIAGQLAKHGYDAEALNAEARVQAGASLAVFEKSLASLRRQSMKMLREIGISRDYALRARKFCNEHTSEEIASSRAEIPQSGKRKESTGR